MYKQLLIRKIKKYRFRLNQTGGANNNKYAIITLLMINENYLPGLIVLANSINKLKKPSNISLICMVTPDISEDIILELKKYYDIVDKVNYIEIDQSMIRHKNEYIKSIYAKTFTKINCLKYTDYTKILLIDADMIVLNDKFFDVFNYNTPSGVFTGCIWEDDLCDKYKIKLKTYGHSLEDNKRISKAVFNFKLDARGKNTVETSICLLKPSIEDFNNMYTILKNAKINELQGDTSLIFNYYENQWYSLDRNYLARWKDPDVNKDLIVLDLYGSAGKPWDIEKYDTIKEYSDVRYWIKIFIQYYEDTIKFITENKRLKELYIFLKSKSI